MNSNAGEFRAQTPGDERRSSITRRSLITGLQGGYIAGWTRPRPRATPLRRRSARAAPPWRSRRARRAHATDLGCRAQCGRSNDLLLTRSTSSPDPRLHSRHDDRCTRSRSARPGAHTRPDPSSHPRAHTRTHAPPSREHDRAGFISNMSHQYYPSFSLFIISIKYAQLINILIHSNWFRRKIL